MTLLAFSLAKLSLTFGSYLQPFYITILSDRQFGKRYQRKTQENHNLSLVGTSFVRADLIKDENSLLYQQMIVEHP